MRSTAKWSAALGPPRTRGQDGFAVIEVVVSAMVMVAIGGGALAALQASDRSVADERHHARAFGVAQQDQARMRSLKISELSNLNQTQNRARGRHALHGDLGGRVRHRLDRDGELRHGHRLGRLHPDLLERHLAEHRRARAGPARRASSRRPTARSAPTTARSRSRSRTGRTRASRGSGSRAPAPGRSAAPRAATAARSSATCRRATTR